MCAKTLFPRKSNLKTNPKGLVSRFAGGDYAAQAVFYNSIAKALRKAYVAPERFFALFVFAQLLFFGRSEDLAIRKIGKAGAKKFYV